MIRIGIELNNIVRNINFQVMKYYKKDVNPSFDESTVSPNKCSIIEDITFESNKKRNEFVFVDYPYEIFGCARVMERNLSVTINNWLLSLLDIEKEKYDVSFFSLRENDLSIPSTYYFLSKIATRVRKMWFPASEENPWDMFDIIITTNKEIVENKPQGKIAVLINKEDNTEAVEHADFNYDLLSDAIKENKFITNVTKYFNNVTTVYETKIEKKNKSIFDKIASWFK